MLLELTRRLIAGSDARALGSFALNLGVRGGVAMLRHRLRLMRGRCMPPVLFISVTTRCNLRCQGCWVAVDGPPVDMPAGELDRIIRSARRRGNHFFGLLGGEPLAYGPLMDVIARHGDCYFQVLTNGTMLDRDVARRFRRLANVSPLISIEGRRQVSDQRRGGSGVYDAALAGLENCRREGLIFGTATSLCRSNLDDLLSDAFIADVIAAGAAYMWYYIYRPCGPRPCGELALDAEEIRRVREFIVDARRRHPILLIDAYWDQLGRPICPAARGVSHHVNPWGQLEPCPPIQFARECLLGRRDPAAAVAGSQFMSAFRRLAAASNGGCVLMERPRALLELAQRCGAVDSSGRGTAADELMALTARPSHRAAGEPIAERHWLYRQAKKHMFFGLGAYG